MSRPAKATSGVTQAAAPGRGPIAPNPIAPRYTQAFRLTPSSLVSTAAADIAKHARNKDAARAYRYSMISGEETLRPRVERLGFYPADVRNAKRPAEVLTRAQRRIRRASEPLTHRQKNRALLYDTDLLDQALTLASRGGPSGGDSR